jgi:hypothetical protein
MSGQKCTLARIAADQLSSLVKPDDCKLNNHWRKMSQTRTRGEPC